MLHVLLGLPLLGKLCLLAVAVIMGLVLYNRFTRGACTSNKRMDVMTVIVTGANTGIGKEIAKDLARRGAKVILACRSLENGRAACEEIKKVTASLNVKVMELDLCSLKSIRKFASEILHHEHRLDVLVNNAGISGESSRTLTEDGLETVMATNYFGAFLLTNLLLGLLKKTAPSRIVNVSSIVYKNGRIEFDNLNSEKRFVRKAAYCNSKLAMVLFSRELSRRLEHTGVTSNCLHPGAARTGLYRNYPLLLRMATHACVSLFGRTAVEAAQTSIHLSVSMDVETVSGEYFMDCKTAPVSQNAKDMEVAKKLWAVSEELVGLKAGNKHS